MTSLPPYTTLSRRTPVKKHRSKPRPGRLRGAEMSEMRGQVFDREKGICAKCGKKFATDLAHKRNKRMWGDSPENTEAWCADCHRIYHAYGPSMTKPCPPKSVSSKEGRA